MADGILQMPNFANALLGGYQAGQAISRQRRLDQAYSLYATDPKASADALFAAGAPEQADLIYRRDREQRRNALVGQVLSAPTPQGGALSGAPAVSPAANQSLRSFNINGTSKPGQRNTLGSLIRRQAGEAQAQPAPLFSAIIQDPEPVEAAPAATDAPAAPIAPSQLVDPASLPARTDGLALNQDALRQLYAEDPETAHQLQTWAHDANKQQFDEAKQRASVMGNVAFKLRKLPADARAAELNAYAPALQHYGFTPEVIDAADLSDAGLDRYLTLAQTYSGLVDDDRQDRRLSADIDNMAADNQRSDRDLSSRIEDRAARRGLIARGQDLTDARGRYGISVTSADRRRGQDMTSADRRRGQDVRAASGGGRKAPGANPPPVIRSRAEFSALPSGAVFVGPDGKQRRKP